MSDDKPCRSRTAWAAPAPVELVEPKAKLRRIDKLLLFALVLLVAAVGALTFFVYQQQLYVQGRGEYRDAEAARIEQQGEERIRQAMCDLLDQLPEGGLLERPRNKYGCGPGIPLSQLPPEQQEQLRAQRSAPVPPPLSQPVAPAPRSAPKPLVEGANPGGSDLTPEAVPTPPPSTASEPPPLVDLGPYTGPLCDSVRVCF